MKEVISEDDVKKSLREQLEYIGKDNIPVIKHKKKKRSGESKADDSHEEKRKRLNRDKLNDAASLSIKNTVTQRPTRPPPRVVVFEEPGKSKGKSTSHNNSSKLKDKSTEDSEVLDFLEISRDVKEFGMTGFSKKERRKYEQQKVQALGAKPPKGAKMPYNILIAHKKKQKEKEMKRLKLEKAMGMSTKKSKNKTKKKETSTSSTGWWSDKSSKGLDASIGRYKKGVQTITQSDIRKIRHRTK